MKTIKRKVLVVVFMLGTLLNYANNLENYSTKLDAKKISIIFNNAKKGHYLTVKDETGTILHSETVTKAGMLKKIFDFSYLENGKYVVELNKDFEIVVKSFEVKDNMVIYNKDSKKVIFKPVVKNEENYLMISKIAFDKKPMNVTLYYENNIIYQESLKSSDDIINRVYKLDEKKRGSYKLILNNNDRSYIKNFKI